jgi:group I intron endonuclease
MLSASIYTITNLANDKVYVGSTRDFNRRKGQHLSRLRANKHHSKHLQNAWNKYGESYFKVVEVESVDPLFATAREQFWIWRSQCTERKYGYNTVERACGNGGAPHTDASRLAMSRARKGKRTPRQVAQWNKLLEANWGRKRSPEVVAKIAEANRGRQVSEETRKLIGQKVRGFKHTLETKEKIGEASRGRTVSPETRKKISDFHKGREVSEETRALLSAIKKGRLQGSERYNALGVIQLSLKGDVIAYFEAGAVAARATGCQNTLITKVIKGKLNKTGGFIWRRVEQLDDRQMAQFHSFRDDKPVEDGHGV